MWARVVEACLGVWLAMSPFVFSYGAGQAHLWWIDFGAATLVVVFAMAAFYRPLHRAGLMNAAVGMGLALYGYFGAGHPPPGHAQNHLIVGLILVLFGIIPSQVTQMPVAWRRYYGIE